MKRLGLPGLFLLAVMLVALLLKSTIRWDASPRRGAADSVRVARYYHAGKTGLSPVSVSPCQTGSCHGNYPHEGNQAGSAFFNMHQEFIECLACHGIDYRDRRKVKATDSGKGTRSAGQRVNIGYQVPAGKEGEGGPHILLGPPAACRQCHSEAGRTELKGLGGKDLPAGFANPIALRMMEEGAKRWIPSGMR